MSTQAEITSEQVSATFAQLQRGSKYAAVVFTVLAAVPIACLIGASIVICPQFEDGSLASMASMLVSVCAQMIILSAIFATCANMLGCIAKGQSPFCRKNICLLNMIAALFLAYSFCDTITNNIWLTEQVGDTAVRIVHQDSPSMGINVTMIAISIMFFCFSAIFKYGSLLQEVSDDTI